MKRFQIRVLPKAEEHLATIEAWWRVNRREHPTLVREELREALRVLAAFPDAGVDHRPRRRPRIQKILLKQSKHYVFYRALVDDRVVEILAIWSTKQGKEPPLG